MNLKEKAAAVELVFIALDEEIKQFQIWSRLGCKVGCGKCCYKADIEATPLEFLPFAFHVCQSGNGDHWLDQVKRNPDNPICIILNSNNIGTGFCSDYVHRGLICRLFGFSARKNKYDRKELVTCSTIKTEHQINYQLAMIGINEGASVPSVSSMYQRLNSIDVTLANQFMPINLALERALELTLQFLAYTGDEALV